MAGPTLHPAWLVLAGVILIRGFCGGGVNMTAGLFLAPVAGHLRVGIGTLSLYLSIIALAQLPCMPLAGRLLHRWDVRWAAVLGGALQALPFAALGLLHNVYGWYLLAIPQALGGAITVNLLGPILINRWFARNVGTLLGIQMACVSLFGAVLQPYGAGLIAREGWRSAYVVLGTVSFLATAAAGGLLLRSRPEDLSLSPWGGAKPGEETPTAPAEGTGVSAAAAVRTPSFCLLVLLMAAITGAAVFSQHVATFGAMLGFSHGETGLALSLGSAGSALGAVVMGLVSDRMGGLRTCYWMIGIGMLSVLGFLLSARSFFLFAAASALHGLMRSGIVVLFPTLTLEFFGSADYEVIYSRVALGAPLASILLVPAYGYLFDATGSYSAVLLFMLATLILAIPCVTVAWKKR